MAGLSACTAGGAAEPSAIAQLVTPVPTGLPIPSSGTIAVDVGLRLGQVPPLAFGTNVGPWQNLTDDRLPLVDAAGFTFLRFPGGNWGDEYRLLERHVDEFVALARRVNAEPMIHVRLFRGSPDQAAGWVAYANNLRGYGVHYWAIGNEPSLYATSRGAIDYDVEAFNTQWREFALAMKTADPSILLLGPETHQYTGVPGEGPVDRHGVNWLKAFLEANGDLVDIVSVHRYPFGTWDPSAEALLRNSAEWDSIIPNLRRDIVEVVGEERPIAITEVNSNWSNRSGGETTPDSLLNAIWWADSLGRMISHEVDIVANFALEGAGGLGMLGPEGPRPIYSVYNLFRLYGRERVGAASGLEGVSVYAALREDGALSILLVNLGHDRARGRLSVSGFDGAEETSVWRLDRDHPGESLPSVAWSTLVNFDLPEESVTLFVVPPR
jgi:hypothetical protein